MVTYQGRDEALERFRVLTERLHVLQGNISETAQARKAIIRRYRSMGLSWSEIARIVDLHRTHVARLGSKD